MIRVEVITQFTLGKFDEIKDSIVRKSVDTEGMLYVGDTFECTKEMADYLTGKNEKGNVVVKVIEIIPDEIKEEPKVEIKEEKPKTTKKKKTTKK